MWRRLYLLVACALLVTVAWVSIGVTSPTSVGAMSDPVDALG